MELVLAAAALYLVSALLVFLFRKTCSDINLLGAFSAVTASLAGLAGSVYLLFRNFFRETPFLHLSAPAGFFSDYLSSFFLLTLFTVLFAVSLYSLDYLRNSPPKRPLWLLWFNYHILAAAMTVVLISSNAAVFMLAWETMAVSSFLLVMTDNEKKEVRKAGLIYLAANGIGALFLIMAFSLLTGPSSWTFSSAQENRASLIFFFSLVGFGLKAGLVPLHVWLPEAHPAAPGNVSAIMSGVMIKLGIYGLIRTLFYITPWQDWWGWTILGLGAVSGLLGVLFALAQHEIKKLLAYHSVENIGIILLGLGLAVILWNHGLRGLSTLAFFGSLLHVFNHAVFKSLLFMGAGSVIRSTHSGELEALGGLYRKMPMTALLFASGAAAISGLPPFNGFISEFLIYYSAFSALGTALYPAAIAAILPLSAIGALALACFAKAFGVIFLGEPRSEKTAKAGESGKYALFGMALLAAICLFIGLFSPAVFKYGLLPASNAFAHDPACAAAYGALIYISAALLFLLGSVALAFVLRRGLLSGKKTRLGPTWDCGYAAPSSSMQYTASSFAQPLTDFFRPLLGISYRGSPVAGLFPDKADFHSENKAVFFELFYRPAGSRIRKFSARYSFIQSGRLQFYVLYIVAALVFLIIWKI